MSCKIVPKTYQKIQNCNITNQKRTFLPDGPIKVLTEGWSLMQELVKIPFGVLYRQCILSGLLSKTKHWYFYRHKNVSETVHKHLYLSSCSCQIMISMKVRNNSIVYLNLHWILPSQNVSILTINKNTHNYHKIN